MICTGCKIDKPNEDFYKRNTRKSYQSWCKVCVCADSVRYQQRNPRQSRAFRIKYKYGITLEEVHEKLETQNYRCGICRCNLEDIRYHIDHDSKTNQVRDILCGRCNMAFGLFDENIEYLKNAINYKLKWSSLTPNVQNQF